MIRWVAMILALLASLPAAAASGPADPPPKVQVTLTRDKDGAWLIDYRFDMPARAWFYPRSAPNKAGNSWRLASWTVETPGVTLTRAGNFDTLSAAQPLTRVRIRMVPYGESIPTDYTPALRFSDGGLALLTDQLSVMPMESLAAVRALPFELRGMGRDPPTLLTVRDPGGRLLLRGKLSTGTVSVAIDRVNTYIYAGNAPITQTSTLAGVIDSGLPGWIGAELRDFTPKLMALYNEKLGASAIGRPMALIAWGGTARGGWIMDGGVLDGMLAMQIEGTGLVERKPDTLEQIRWFIGHESAHFWLDQTIAYSRTTEAWITEGGSDFLATRAMEAILPDFDADRAFRKGLAECLSLIKPNKPLATAEEQGLMKAYYSCGSMLALAAEYANRRVYPDADHFQFQRDLIAKNRTRGVVSADVWLLRFSLLCGDDTLTREVRRFIFDGVPDPRAFFRRLFTALKVPVPTDAPTPRDSLKNSAVL